MQPVTSAILESYVSERKHKMEGALLEQAERLIVQSCPDVTFLQMSQGATYRRLVSMALCTPNQGRSMSAVVG